MSDFDPDAYLAKKRGFDPDAYLAKKAPKAPQEIPLGVRAPDPEAPEPTVGERLWSGLKGIAHTVAGGAGAIGTGIRHPIDTVTDPSRRREFERGIDDIVTWGFGQRLADKVGRALGDAPDVQIAATESGDAQKAPGFRAGGAIAGTFGPGLLRGTLGGVFPALRGASGGATEAVANLAGRVAERAIPAAKGALPGLAMGIPRALIGYELSAPAIAGGQAAARGDNPLRTALNAATDPAGLLISGAAGAGAGAARGKAASIRDPKNLGGRVLRDVEAARGEIKPFGEPVRGGLYETPELADAPHGRKGVVDLAGQSVERVIKANEDRLAAAQEQWGKTADEILAEHGGRGYLADRTHAAIERLDAENQANGVVGDDALARATDKVRRMLTKDSGQAVAGMPGTLTIPGGSVADFMQTRKLVNRMWKHTTDPAEKYAYGEILDAMKEDAAGIDPRIGELNAAYRKTAQDITAVNDNLFAQNRLHLNPSASAKQAAAGRLSRLGDETQAGPLADKRIEAAAAASPDVAGEARLMAAKKAAERLRYGEPEVSTGMEKGRAHVVAHAAKRAVGGAVGAIVGHGAAGHMGAVAGAYLGQKLGSFAENPLALQLRLGLPAAEAIGRHTGIIPGSIADQLYRAYERDKQLAAQRSAAAFGSQ